MAHINIDATPTLSICQRLFTFDVRFSYYVSPPFLPSPDSLLMVFRLLLERASLSFLSYLVYCSLRSDQSLSTYPNKRCRSPAEVMCTSSTAISHTQTNHDTAPLCVRRSSWRYIEGDCKSKYCITGNFCSQISMALNEGCAILGFNCITICLDARSGSLNPYTSIVKLASWR